MRKIIAFICIFAVLISSINVTAFASESDNYTLKINKTTYSYGDYLVGTVTVPDNMDLDYMIEVIKDGYIIAMLQKSADQTEFKFGIAYNWQAGKDYQIRVGRGKTFATANFELVEHEIIINKDLNNKNFVKGTIATFDGTSDVVGKPLTYSIAKIIGDNYPDDYDVVDIKDGDANLLNGKFKFDIKLDETFKVGKYMLFVTGSTEIGELYPYQGIIFNVIDPTVKAEKPVASPVSGQVASGTKVALSSKTTGASIYYTIDGNIPTIKSKEYKEPISITAETTLKAIAVAPGYIDSDVLEQKYTIKTADSTSSGGGGGGGSSTTTYRITLQTNGGEFVGTNPSSLKDNVLTVKDKADKINDPVKKGYIFTGWYTDASLTNKYDFATKVTKNFTLYAGWEKEIIEESKQEDNPPLAIVQPNKTPKFSDIKDHWAEEIINKISEKQIASGYPDGTFKPNNTVTRAEFIKMAVDALGFKVADKSKAFNDVNDNDWFKTYIEIGVSNGIAQGISENLFSPNANISRQDICVIMYNAMVKSGVKMPEVQSNNFSDSDLIADYAKDAVSTLKQLNIVGGRANNSFDHKAPATRAESAKIILGVKEIINNIK